MTSSRGDSDPSVSSASDPTPANERLSPRERFLVVGRIIGPVGLNGEFRAEILTDFPERFSLLEIVHVGDNLRPFQIQSSRIEGHSVLLKLAGIDDAGSARAHRDKDISVPIDVAVELKPDHFFWHQVVGMEVVADDDRVLGNVTEILRTGSNDVYVVGRGDRELLIPAIEDVVLSIDSIERRILVHLIPGIEDESKR